MIYESRASNQYALELARDLVYNLECLHTGEKLTLEVVSIVGCSLFDGSIRSNDQRVVIGQNVGFYLKKVPTQP